MNPLETHPSHPSRRTLDSTGVEIEGGPHADHHRTDAVAMRQHPGFLPWAAQSDEYHLRTGVVDPADDVFVFLGCQFPKGG
jgi:hypothetical protein